MAEEPETNPTPDGEVASLRQALADRDARLKDLESAITEGGTKLETQAVELEGRGKELTALREGVKGVAIKYRKLLMADSPEVPEELVKGETVEEVETSFATARQMVEKVRKGMEAKQRNERVPAGAPPRSPVDLSAMSAQEKIAYGLARGR